MHAIIQVNECANGISTDQICASCVYTHSHGVFSLCPDGCAQLEVEESDGCKCYYERVLQGLQTYICSDTDALTIICLLFFVPHSSTVGVVFFVWHMWEKTLLLLGLLWSLSCFEGVAEHTMKTRLAQHVAGVTRLWLYCRPGVGLKVC